MTPEKNISDAIIWNAHKKKCKDLVCFCKTAEKKIENPSYTSVIIWGIQKKIEKKYI